MARPSLIRDIHSVGVLNLLRENGTASRARLAEELGLTRSTLTSLINNLALAGYVVESGHADIRRGTGRPGVGLALNADGAYFLGAEIGYGALHLVVLDLAGKTIAQRSENFESMDPTVVLSQLARLVMDETWTGPINRERIKGLGVTVPGTIVDDSLSLAPGLGWSDVPIKSLLRPHLPWNVLVENNANAGALAELYLGSQDGRKVGSLVFIHLGMGIGSGIIIGGEIYRGAFGVAGEIGNVRLAQGGPVDRKGNEGTFEAFSSQGAIMQAYGNYGGVAKTPKDLVQQHAGGEAAALRVVAESTNRFIQVVLMLVNVLNPQLIVFGGPMAPIAEVAMADIVSSVRAERLPGSDKMGLRLTTLGDDSHAIGGAMLVYHTMFARPWTTTAI